MEEEMKTLLERDIIKYEIMREKAVLSGDEYAVTVIDIQISRIKAILEDNNKDAAFLTRKLWTMQENGRPKEKNK